MVDSGEGGAQLQRLFVAARLSSAVRRSLEPAVSSLLGGSTGLLRPVPAGSEHLTLVFLGERPAEVEPVAAALDALGGASSFEILLGDAHVFPEGGRPRLVCVDVTGGAERVMELAESCRSRLEPLFHDLSDYRIKSPHVTLARFSRRARRGDAREVATVLERDGLASWSRRERVVAVELIRSELTPSGARYETVHRVLLSGAGDSTS